MYCGSVYLIVYLRIGEGLLYTVYSCVSLVHLYHTITSLRAVTLSWYIATYTLMRSAGPCRLSEAVILTRGVRSPSILSVVSLSDSLAVHIRGYKTCLSQDLSPAASFVPYQSVIGETVRLHTLHVYHCLHSLMAVSWCYIMVYKAQMANKPRRELPHKSTCA